MWGARAVRPHGALRDLAGELHHPTAERGEHDRRQPADLGRQRGHVADKLSDVREGLPRLEPEPLVRRTVTHADPEPEPAARQLVDHRRGLGVVEGMTGVDVRDAGPNVISRVERARASQSARPSPGLGQ